MFFEATIRKKKVGITITETDEDWKVRLQYDKTGKEETHIVKKWDYQRMDDAISFLFDNHSYMVSAVGSGTKYSIYTRGSYRDIKLFNDEILLNQSLKGSGSFGGGDNLVAGMPGKIVNVMVKVGDQVKANQPLLIMEAMKMENEMRAPADTKVKEIKVEKGQSVESGALLIVFGE